MKRILWGLLGAAMLLSVPVGASSEEPLTGEEAAAYLMENRVEETVSPVLSEETDESLPEQFDLRELGYVTPVKFQNPWGTCWGFSAIAAAETSILSESGLTYEETGLDLSEHHLAYFARTYMEEGSQTGEGVHVLAGKSLLNTGGMMFEATSLFSSGIGVVTEALVPYRGLESVTAHRLGKNYYYYAGDDWSLPTEYKFLQSYELEESALLPTSAVYESGIHINSDMEAREAAYIGIDLSAVTAMKQELLAGRAITIAFSADANRPEDLNDTSGAVYLNTADNAWTHYTYDGGVPNHAVTIVGWDDTIKASSFLDHSDDPYGDGEAHQPEGDGAWIVKNSWGSELSDFPNYNDWGIRDEDGNATGYFYLSYYDRSICYAETFDFDVSGEEDASGYIIDQYDYMPCEESQGWLTTGELSMANVFTAGENEILRALSCQTVEENTRVVYEVYLLSENAADPWDGELACRVEETYAYGGYHRITLPESVSVAKGQSYAVSVTQTVGDCYGISVSLARNEEGVTEWNRREYNHNRELSESQMNLMDFYCTGVVNPGESYVYIGELGQWYDFSELVPTLQESEAFHGNDFDNFPVKAYLELADQTVAETMSADAGIEPLKFADPADGVYRPFYFALAGVCVLSAGLVFLLVFVKVRRHRRRKREKRELAELRARLAELETNL